MQNEMKKKTKRTENQARQKNRKKHQITDALQGGIAEKEEANTTLCTWEARIHPNSLHENEEGTRINARKLQGKKTAADRLIREIAAAKFSNNNQTSLIAIQIEKNLAIAMNQPRTAIPYRGRGR